MYNVIELANYIIQRCIDIDKPITNIQLQIVLLAIQEAFGGNAFSSRSIEVDGKQIIPEVYHKFWGIRKMPITFYNGCIAQIKLEHKKIIDKIIQDNVWEE